MGLRRDSIRRENQRNAVQAMAQLEESLTGRRRPNRI
jgi:hypothetical protein